MIKISAELRKCFILISSLSIVFITIISNLSIYYLFSHYIENIRANDDAQIIEYIEREYNQYGKLNDNSQMSIMHYVLSENVHVRIRNLDGKIIYNSDSENSMFNIPITENIHQDSDVKYKNYPFNYKEVLAGTIDIGRPKSIMSNLEDRQFLRTINSVFAISFVFSLLIAVALSLRISKRFLNPIYEIKENAKLIEQGKYKKLKDVNTNTYELHDLSLSVKELSEKLDYQEHLRKRMTNDLAHELRTPLSTVQSHIEAFMDGVWKPELDKLIIIHDEITRLTKLINELADLSHVENDEIKLNKTDVNLSELLNNILISFEPLFINKEINLKKNIQDEVYFKGDEEKLKRIFLNIISNAFKYTNECGKISVNLKNSKNKIIVEVEDSGIGINSEDLKHIFERFYRTDISRNRKTGGMGIGLTITKALVDAHDGVINVESQAGVGTKVIVEFNSTNV